MIDRKQLRYRAFRTLLAAGQVAARPTAGRRALPDFLVIGGQRCGTTSLYHYLDQHPGIRPPRLTKGVHWFDEEYHRPVGWYRSNFALEGRRRRAEEQLGHRVVVGEFSPYYLFHPYIPSRIREVVPDARLIAVLREPIARTWSGYHHEKARGYETLPFEAALDAEPARLAGADSVLADRGARHRSHQHHSYMARSRYAEQLQRLWAAFPREQTLVLYTEDLERDPDRTLARVHDFLGLPRHATTTAQRWNRQSNPDLPAHLRRRLADEFAESNQWLAEHLDPPPPWT